MNFEKTVAVVSGASKGIGAEICAQLSSRLSRGSVVIGIGRTSQALSSTGAKVSEEGVTFLPWVTDLGKLSDNTDDFRKVLREAFNSACSSGAEVQNILMVHNAGSLGELCYLRDKKFEDVSLARDYFNLNLCSLYPMNQIFLEEARTVQSRCADAKIRFVNITSLSALQPFRTWGLYCTGKAARDMLFKVLAQEETDVDVLSYSPGPVDTDMQSKTRTTPDEKLRAAFSEMKESKNLLSTEQTVLKLLRVLEKGEYKSGDHVDYFD